MEDVFQIDIEDEKYNCDYCNKEIKGGYKIFEIKSIYCDECFNRYKKENPNLHVLDYKPV